MPDLVMAWDDVVALDYGQFLLRGVDEYDGDREMELLQQALTDDGVAADTGRVVVLSPHQNNFEMPLRVEVWSARPDDDAPVWEEVFEGALRVGDGGLPIALVGGDHPQSYEVLHDRRVSGTGEPQTADPPWRRRHRRWSSRERLCTCIGDIVHEIDFRARPTVRVVHRDGGPGRNRT